MQRNRISSSQSQNQTIQQSGDKKRVYQSKVNKTRKKPLFMYSNRMGSYRDSNYSSSSKYNSFQKTTPSHQTIFFKQSQSTHFNQLKQKYLERDAPIDKIRDQMIMVLERKVSQLEALRIHRDQLKFISSNNPYQNYVRIGFSLLRQKAKTEQNLTEAIDIFSKDIQAIDHEFTNMIQYYNFLKSSLSYSDDQDLIIDTQAEQKLMIQNLQNQTNQLLRKIGEQDKSNAKQIKNMQMQIGSLRVSIKQKQDLIRDLKSKICTLYIKLNNRNSLSKQKNMSLSIRKFNTLNHSCIQQAFIGNRNFKQFSKQSLQKVSSTDQLVKIIFYSNVNDKQLLTFKCVYKQSQGKKHQAQYEIGDSKKIAQNKPKGITDSKSKYVQIQVIVRYLMSIKFFLKNRIVGVECRLKTDKGNKKMQLGNCQNNVQHQLLTLFSKKIVTFSSFWHQKELIGIGVWYENKIQTKRSANSLSKDKQLKGVKSERVIEPVSQYFGN